MLVTFRQAKAQIEALGLRIERTNANDDEVRVHWPKAKAGEGYFTEDLFDAIDTAKAMAAERAQRQKESAA